MIGELPMALLSPLDYRAALDAALALVGTADPPALICRVNPLEDEAQQRLSVWGAPGEAPGGIWVEPQTEGWRSDLAALALGIPMHGRIAVIVSLPMARLLPERRNWAGRALGMQPGGLAQLRDGLRAAGMRVEGFWGFHTLNSMLTFRLASLCTMLGSQALGDRLHFAARMAYYTQSWHAPLSTVGLISARREGRP